MLKMDIKGVLAVPMMKEPLTAGRVGLRIEFTFSHDWDDLSKIAVFEGATTIDVPLIDDACTVPHEVLASAGPSLRVGVYGMKNEDDELVKATPTVWGSFGRIESGAYPAGASTTPPTADVVATILGAAETAVETANDAKEIAEGVAEAAARGDFKGDQGDPGEQGPAATIEIGTVTTGAPSDPASVTNTGTETAAIFNFTIPKGDKGDPGAAGQNGTNGTDGTDGAPGSQIWTTNVAPTVSSDVTKWSTSDLNGQLGMTPAMGDLVFYSYYYYPITRVVSGEAVVGTPINIRGPQGEPGGGGSSDYDDLTDKPQINSVTLSGDKSTEDLGLDQVYWAAYGMSTNEEIRTAHEAGKEVLCALTVLQLPPVPPVIARLVKQSSNTLHYFAGVDADGKICMASCDNGTWTQFGFPPLILADSFPADLGSTPDGGVSSFVSRSDHVHQMPSAANVGAIAAPSSPSSGDVLTYNGSAWAGAAPAHQIPAGGNAGECLAKTSATDYDLRWRTINDWTPAGLMRTNGGTAAKVAEWSFWSATQYPSWLVVTVGNSNTYAGAITLKVNGSTAYPIYINGTASSATNYTLPAGSYFVYFDGSKFDFRTDGKIPGSVIGHADLDIAAPASPSVGDFLVYTSNGWAAQSLSTWQGGNY